VTRTCSVLAQLHVDVDAPALLAGVDAVAHGVLDQREQRHRRALQSHRRVIDRSANCNRSGMRICITSR
jgi:hypothetical protein